MTDHPVISLTRRAFSLGAASIPAVVLSSPARAFVSPIKQSVAENIAGDEILGAFYRARDFEPLWFGADAPDRRSAFLRALDIAPQHGLPAARYEATQIPAQFAAATDARAQGALDVEMSRKLLRYASDISTGFLTPSRVDPELVLTKPLFDGLSMITEFSAGDPFAALHALWPRSAGYTRLLREKLTLEEVRAAGGWGAQVSAKKLSPGDTGRGVVQLRDRLIRMGYLKPTLASSFDEDLTQGVRAFQQAHGLVVDGVAGAGTLRAVNRDVEDRLEQVLVGLERHRWMNKPLESRHIFVNLAEFMAYVVDAGEVTFETVVVVGANDEDRRTPEFSDTMTHMVVNPTWHVPRSIATKEYLPQLKKGGARHLKLYRGKTEIDREGIDFSAFDEKNFPYDLKQPPSSRNALGLVKFMFPNRWNIYLHDTPAKSLFNRNTRAFSHGCVRVQRPFELAHHLLAPQESNPKGRFDAILATKNETYVHFKTPVGVHLVYWTVWVDPKGRVHYRDDVYGRDRRILAALKSAGVDLRAREV